MKKAKTILAAWSMLLASQALAQGDIDSSNREVLESLQTSISQETSSLVTTLLARVEESGQNDTYTSISPRYQGEHSPFILNNLVVPERQIEGDIISPISLSIQEGELNNIEDIIEQAGIDLSSDPRYSRILVSDEQNPAFPTIRNYFHILYNNAIANIDSPTQEELRLVFIDSFDIAISATTRRLNNIDCTSSVGSYLSALWDTQALEIRAGEISETFNTNVASILNLLGLDRASQNVCTNPEELLIALENAKDKLNYTSAIMDWEYDYFTNSERVNEEEMREVIRRGVQLVMIDLTSNIDLASIVDESWIHSSAFTLISYIRLGYGELFSEAYRQDMQDLEERYAREYPETYSTIIDQLEEYGLLANLRTGLKD